MLRAIIFDWHGVLDKTKFSGVIENVSRSTKIPVSTLGNLMKDFEGEYALTRTPEVAWNRLKAQFDLSTLQLRSAKIYALTIQQNVPLWDLLPALKTKYQLAILSDCPLDKVRKIRWSLPEELKLFDAVHFSSEKQLTKVNTLFFVELAQELGLSPRECLYVDDRKEHVESAAKLSFKTCLFQKMQDLHKKLRVL